MTSSEHLQGGGPAGVISHEQPHQEIYSDPDRKHPGRDRNLPLRTIQLHVSQLCPGKGTNLHKHHASTAICAIPDKSYIESRARSTPRAGSGRVVLPRLGTAVN